MHVSVRVCASLIKCLPAFATVHERVIIIRVITMLSAMQPHIVSIHAYLITCMRVSVCVCVFVCVCVHV
jgi:hypothetical protein